MAAIAKTSDQDVITAARAIIAECGVDGLSMQAIGDLVGVKAPSLYKRFRDREEIIRRVQLAEFAGIEKKIRETSPSLSAIDTVRAIANIYWALAGESPNVYAVLFTAGTITAPNDIAVRTSALMPLFTACQTLVGHGIALAAARTLASYMHGFLSMRLSGAFDGTPGLEGSYFFGLNAIIKGML